MSICVPSGLTILERTLGMPGEGPKMVPMLLDFSLASSFELDYSNQQRLGYLSMVQALFVDNSLSSDVLVISIGASQQTLKISAKVQGYFPVLIPNPPKMTFASDGGVVCGVTLLNFPVSGFQWVTA